MWKIALIPVFTILVVWIWQFLNWAWFKPRKIDRFLRKQGMKGNSYRFVIGDSKETSLMYEKAYSTPIGLKDDIVPRVMPNILLTLQKYGNYSFSWSGPRPRIFINDPGVARDVLNKYRLHLKNFQISNDTVTVLVTRLANKEGEEWTKSRSRVNPVFHMVRQGGVYYFECCWKKFMHDNSLESGEMLTFAYAGSILFYVRIFSLDLPS